MELKQWKLAPLKSTSYFGELVSFSSFDDSLWSSVTVPGTVVAHLVESGQWDDPYYGLNMRLQEGFKEGAETHFAFHPMPLSSPFREPIWYRTTFENEASWLERTWIRFHGINFKADIWLNGKRIAATSGIAGPYRIYDLDVTPFIVSGQNTLVVQLWAQAPDDLGITFIDWSPTPSDESAGIWRPVEVYHTKAQALKDPHVRTTLTDTQEADVWVGITVDNRIKTDFEGELQITVDGQKLRKRVSVLALDGEEYALSFHLKKPALWWPWDLGDQPLYTALIELFDDDENLVTQQNITFGIREITATINEHGARQIGINGQPYLIRGSAWSPELLLRQSTRRDEMDVAYIKAMNLNTVRLEGHLASDYFWELCDKEGILVIAGWPCCTHWEQWEKWKPDDYHIAQESLKSQLIRLRNHASFALWLYGSDYPPIPKVERLYLDILKRYGPSVVTLSSAAQFASKVTGPSGVKMSGPYGYVPPLYWYTDSMPGVAKGFNTETGPDASFPRYDSLCRMLPKEERYVGSKAWNHHAGLASFLTTEVMQKGLEDRYGVSPDNLEEYMEVAQLISYECWRAMYEAYGRNFPEGTGVIGWMLNGHWPSLIWQKYDYWMVPTGGYYGTKKACELVHIQYSYDDHSVWLINHTAEPLEGEVVLRIYDEKSREVVSQRCTAKVPAQGRVSCVHLPKREEEFSFLHLQFKDSEGAVVSRNVYWLSGQPESFEPKQEMVWWYYRPLIEAPSFAGLLALPQARVQVDVQVVEHLDSRVISVTLRNVGETFAVGGQLDLWGEDGHIIAPVMWSENLLFLAPGEELTVIGSLVRDDYDGAADLKIVGRNFRIEMSLP